MLLLSVDDSKSVRDIIKSSAEVLGYDFMGAQHGKEALELLKEIDGKADVILLDWNMPVMNGIETLKALKNNPEYSDIPVVMVTTESEREKIIEAIAAGAKNYVTKPFTQEELITKIMASLGMA